MATKFAPDTVTVTCFSPATSICEGEKEVTLSGTRKVKLFSMVNTLLPEEDSAAASETPKLTVPAAAPEGEIQVIVSEATLNFPVDVDVPNWHWGVSVGSKDEDEGNPLTVAETFVPPVVGPTFGVGLQSW